MTTDSIMTLAMIGSLIIGYILGLFIFAAIDSHRFKQLLRRLDSKANQSKPTSLNGINFIRDFYKQLGDKQNENNSHSG